MIEVDGRQHSCPKNVEKDNSRDEALGVWGIKVLRYSNESVRKYFNNVAEDILKNLDLNFDDLNLK